MARAIGAAMSEDPGALGWIMVEAGRNKAEVNRWVKAEQSRQAFEEARQRRGD